MAKYKDFLKEFEKSLPKFIQGYSKEIATDIIQALQNGANKDGVELRGFFSLQKKKGEKRNAIIFRDFKTQK